MIDFVGKRFWWFLLSAAVLVPGIISLAIPQRNLPLGLTLGIEFTSGSSITLHFDQKVEQSDLRALLAQIGYGDAILQREISAEGNFLVRTGEIKSSADKDTLISKLTDKFGHVTANFDTVAPIVASETVRNAALAVAVAAIAILLYISYAFRKVQKPFRYGVCAIIAMVHDIFVVLGVFSILGRFFNLEIDAMFITGMLTVVGYSVHDTIVVFDRIRENSQKGISKDFGEIVNYSVNQTLGRSLNTSLTVLFVLVALFLFGGATIKNFILVLLIGIITGTYSSIFNAAQLLVVWEKKEWGKFIFWRPLLRRAPAENRKAVV